MSKKKPKIKTTFSVALKKYRKTQIYKESLQILHEKGIQSPYADNILTNAFSRGFTASGVEIKVIN